MGSRGYDGRGERFNGDPDLLLVDVQAFVACHVRTIAARAIEFQVIRAHPVSSSRTLCYPCHMADDDVTAELERLRAENAPLKRTASRDMSLRVSEKGGVSVYGLGRFPVTLYKEQWTKLLDMADDIRAFIRAHESSLKTKS